LVFGLDLVSTFAFALAGARVAANKGLDFGGILFIAAVASISGGTLRNLFMGGATIVGSAPLVIRPDCCRIFDYHRNG
jgi:uncharacterized membrane protein YeiH